MATPVRRSGHKVTDGLATLKWLVYRAKVVCQRATLLRTSLAYATNTFMRDPYSRRLTNSFFSSAIALAGFSPFGHAFVQFKIVWQR